MDRGRLVREVGRIQPVCAAHSTIQTQLSEFAQSCNRQQTSGIFLLLSLLLPLGIFAFPCVLFPASDILLFYFNSP